MAKSKEDKERKKAREARKKERAKLKKERAKERKLRKKEEKKQKKLKAREEKKQKRLKAREEKKRKKLKGVDKVRDESPKTAEEVPKVAEAPEDGDQSSRETKVSRSLLSILPLDKIFIGAGLILFVGAAIYTGVFYVIDKKSAKVWDEVRTHVAVRESVPTQVNEVGEEIPQYVSPYEDLFEMNSDMVGWLKIEDMEVDYPIMYTPDDEDHYLNYNFYDEYDHNGCLVLAGPNDIDKPSTNLLIHGHHMRSGAMFGNLAKYKDLEFRDSHTEITMYTRYEERHYEVVGAMDAKVLGAREEGFRYYSFFDAVNQKEVNPYIEEANKYNLYEDREITLDFWAGDQLLTLSTCRGRAGGKDRFVLMLKRVQSEIVPRDPEVVYNEETS